MQQLLRPRFWRTFPTFVVVVGLVFAFSGLGGVGFLLGALVGVVLSLLTELFRLDCGPEVSWSPPRGRLPPLEYQEKFRPSVATMPADEGISTWPMHEEARP